MFQTNIAEKLRTHNSLFNNIFFPKIVPFMTESGIYV